MTLLAICMTLYPMRIDETIYLHLREKFIDKLPKPLLSVGYVKEDFLSTFISSYSFSSDGKLPFRDNFAYGYSWQSLTREFLMDFRHVF